MGIDSVASILNSVKNDAEPPIDYSQELCALWYAKKGAWDEAHDLISNIHSAMGSWIHAHLHVIEGDLGNASYWYNKAEREPSPPHEVESEWLELVQANL